MKLKLPNWGSLCNPNLLMNCDYRSGIINQKGETSYAYVDKALLTIDGWISYGVNVGLDADSIRIINRQTSDRTLRQYVEGKSGTYTVYVNVKSITGNVYVNFNQDISKNKKLVKGKNIFQITLSSSENLSSFTLLLEANADIYIHCMKLEPGEHFTGMPPWNRASELEKCKERFLFVPVIFNGYVDENGKIFIACEDSRKLVKEPSLIIDANTQIVLYYDDGNGTYLLENIKEGRYATKDGYICLGTLTSYKNWRISGYYKSGKIFLDTYDYD
ncbi:hypothetical protein HMPREF3037_00335 [Candidatus Stoquefichus sp. KLE1796]|nr:hypothetical protein HMPREF3037_00335 [Candidatus Stoquefichus sp. KLE1796]